MMGRNIYKKKSNKFIWHFKYERRIVLTDN